MKITDARIIHLKQEFPYNGGFGTIEVYEYNGGNQGLKIDLTYPAKEGDKHHTCEHFEAIDDNNR